MGFCRLVFLAALAWAFALPLDVPPLPSPAFLAFSFFAALLAAFSASALRWRGTSFAVASAALRPTWGRTLWQTSV